MTQHPQSPSPTRRGRLRRLATTLLSISALVFGTVAIAAPASAATIEAIDPASIRVTHTTGGTEVLLFDELRIDANWAAPQGAAAGDTFRLTLPAEFSVNGGSFPLEADGGKIAGTCEVVPQTATTLATIDCELSNYVTGKDNVFGALWFKVQATTVTENTEVEFGVGAGHVKVPLPGEGGIHPRPNPMPGDLNKGGYVVIGHEDVIAWKVVAPGNMVSPTGDLVIRDVYANDLKVIENSTDFPILVHSMDRTQEAWELNEWDDIPAATVVVSPDTHELTATIPGPIDPDKLYELFYHTRIMVPHYPGDTFDNTASFNGTERHATVTITETGGGTGSGTPRGEIEVRKVVSGEVQPGLDYVVEASFTRFGVPETRELDLDAGGEAVRINNLPVGTVVTLTERLPELQTSAWQTPVYSGQGVVDGGDGTATVTVTADQTVEVTVTNALVRPEGPLGGLTLTKQVVGPGAAVLPSDTEFSVAYATSGPAGATSGRLSVSGGKTASLTDLPVGTEVTLSEIAPEPMTTSDGSTVTFGTPQFSVDGAPGAEVAVVTIGAGTPVAVALTNPTTLTPPPIVPPPVTTPPAGTVPPTKPLPVTGGTDPFLPGIAGGAFLLLGAAAVLTARRRSRARAAQGSGA